MFTPVDCVTEMERGRIGTRLLACDFMGEHHFDSDEWFIDGVLARLLDCDLSDIELEGAE